jgi:hypothetical protein
MFFHESTNPSSLFLGSYKTNPNLTLTQGVLGYLNPIHFQGLPKFDEHSLLL